jgi:hypothetical protein
LAFASAARNGHLDAHRAGSTFREFYTPNVLPVVERASHRSDPVVLFVTCMVQVFA